MRDFGLNINRTIKHVLHGLLIRNSTAIMNLQTASLPACDKHYDL